MGEVTQHKTLATAAPRRFLYLSFVGDGLPVLGVELEVPGLDFPEEARLVLVVEGRVAAQEDVDDHADAPHVHRLYTRGIGRARGDVRLGGGGGAAHERDGADVG